MADFIRVASFTFSSNFFQSQGQVQFVLLFCELQNGSKWKDCHGKRTSQCRSSRGGCRESECPFTRNKRDQCLLRTPDQHRPRHKEQCRQWVGDWSSVFCIRIQSCSMSQCASVETHHRYIIKLHHIHMVYHVIKLWVIDALSNFGTRTITKRNLQTCTTLY